MNDSKIAPCLSIVAVLTLAAASATSADQPATQGTPAPSGAAAGAGRGGPPPPPQNLQLLAKDIPRQELLQTMRGFAQGLGVQCNFCHVQEGPGGRTDMAADDKPTKKTARVMMQMTMHVNEELQTGLAKPAAEMTRVQCMTCHRGEKTPTLPPPAAAPPAQAAQPPAGR